MQCDNCHDRTAAIHLTQIVNNSVTTLHLCEPCAAEKGVQTAATVAYGVAQGANILRVHDVKYMRRVVRMMDASVRHGHGEHEQSI